MPGQTIPYCGLPPLPADLLHRFNLQPALILILTVCLLAHLTTIHHRADRRTAAAGWAIAAAAFISPLCALSVSLFSARIAQHMILVLLAAPLIAVGGPA